MAERRRRERTASGRRGAEAAIREKSGQAPSWDEGHAFCSVGRPNVVVALEPGGANMLRPPVALTLVIATLLPGALPAHASEEVSSFRNGPDVAYPLQHDFSMAVGLPGHGKNEPTSCYDGEDGEYLCRIVAGYEETGDKRNFLVPAQDALDDDSHPTFGHALVARDGIQYEGCTQWRNGDWFCDYASRRHVARRHYEDKRWVLRVLWDWGKYTSGQAGCATALSGWWGKTGGILVVSRGCLNGPLENPGRT